MDKEKIEGGAEWLEGETEEHYISELAIIVDEETLKKIEDAKKRIRKVRLIEN